MNDEVNQVTEGESREVTATDQALMTAITKAELDQAVIRADAKPRSITKFLKECRELVCLDEHTADECIFALPRREKDKASGKWVTKFIEGPSVRMAEIIAYCWRNNRIGARVTDEGREFVTAQGVFQDLERNTFVTFEVRRRITTSEGRRYNADMIQQTGNAACSIASRNATTRGIPKALWEPIYQEAQKVCAGDARTLVSRRAEALQALSKLHVTAEMVCAALGVEGTQDITVDHIAHLRGLHNAVRDGELSIEEAFAPKQPEQPTSRVEAAKDALRGDGAPAATVDSTSSDHIPQFDPVSADKALRACKNLRGLETVMQQVRTDYQARKAELPLEALAAYDEMKEALTERDTKQLKL